MRQGGIKEKFNEWNGMEVKIEVLKLLFESFAAVSLGGAGIEMAKNLKVAEVQGDGGGCSQPYCVSSGIMKTVEVNCLAEHLFNQNIATKLTAVRTTQLHCQLGAGPVVLRGVVGKGDFDQFRVGRLHFSLENIGIRLPAALKPTS